MAANVEIEIKRDPTAPAAARRAIERLDGEIDPALIPDVKLLVSELITNSVKYGGSGEGDLIVKSDDREHVYVEGIDQGIGFVPIAPDPPTTQGGGRGLHPGRTPTQRVG